MSGRYSKRMKRLLHKYPKEFLRDYRRHEKLPSDNILPCDYEDVEDDADSNEYY